MSTLQAAALTGRREVIIDTRGTSDMAEVMIASVSDQDWYISRTHGMYHIPACKKGEAFASCGSSRAQTWWTSGTIEDYR
jgi:hypothetical protein